MQKSPCRSPDTSPVRSDRTVAKVKPESQGPTPFLRPKTPPGHEVIDLSDSSPFQSPTPQKRPIPPPAESNASQARTKRKHTPSSVPPSGLGSPPAKRSKIASAAVPARKHDVHWALDGSIVIQIQDIKFKLHKSHLAKHSPWFSGLFDGATVTGGEYVERVDDDGSTPMYILSLPRLTAKDFTRLLDGFDNAIIYVHQDPSFPRIASILRAATLLSFPDFRDWAIRLLEDRWSPALADLSTERITHATESVLLSRACGAPTFLKRAMYELVRLAGYGQTPNREGVAGPDFYALVRAREQLTALWVQTVSPYSQDFVDCAGAAPVPPAPPAEVECTTANALLAGKAHRKLMQESGIVDDYLYDPVCGLQALIEADWAAEGYCAPCVALRRKVWAGRREKIWENLDVWFGLD
ncbi:hypothetical protein DFH06DRAFT_972136 [Mycena polygramma]|nr:hypothetical protein DFH06DRAFT_972136 [Mycena polygramma]